MLVKSIELKNFRNYVDEKVSFDEKVNIFLGSNAQGKTNLLEGIYLNSFGKSFKNVKDKDLIRFGEGYCKVKTVFETDEEESTNEIVIGKDGKKGIKVDGVKVKKSSELLDRIYMIVFSPEDLKIVKDEPEKRRKFIDRELCQIRTGYLSDLNNYRKVIKQRNHCLKEDNIDLSILSLWDMQLEEFGNRISERRKEFINRIETVSREIHSKLTGNKEKLTIRYNPSVFDPYNIEEDIMMRTTTKGPHRDDFKLYANGIDIKKFGSQGQQRTAALSLKLSEIKIIEEEKREKPVLLLDDVLSELDNERQIYLINSLGENQMFITTTDLTGLVYENTGNGKVFYVSNGKIENRI